MEHDPELTPLPDALAGALRSLGAVPAPPELEQRVRAARQLQALAPLEAPAQLWQRVAPAVAEIGRSGRVLPFRRPAAARWSRGAAVAAGLLLAVGLSLAYFSEAPQPGPDPMARAEARARYRARVIAIEVAPADMSPEARSLAAALGAPDFGRGM